MRCLLFLALIFSTLNYANADEVIASIEGFFPTVQFTSDGKSLVTIHEKDKEKRLTLWDIATGKEQVHYNLSTDFHAPPIVLDGELGLFAQISDSSKKIRLAVTRIETGEEIYARRMDKDFGMRLHSFSPDGQFLSWSTYKNTTNVRFSSEIYRKDAEWRSKRQFDKVHFKRILHFVHLPSGARHSTPDIYGDMIFAAAFSSDGRYLATGSKDMRLRVWSTSDDKLVMDEFDEELREKSNLSHISVQFSPDGKYLASLAHSFRESPDGTKIPNQFEAKLKVRDIAGGKVTTVSDRCFSYHFIPKGNQIFFLEDKVLCCWDLGKMERIPLPLLDEVPCWGFELSSNGERVLMFVGDHILSLSAYGVCDIKTLKLVDGNKDRGIVHLFPWGAISPDGKFIALNLGSSLEIHRVSE